MEVLRKSMSIAFDKYNPNVKYPKLLEGVKNITDLRKLVEKKPFEDIKLFAVEAALTIKEQNKNEDEYHAIIRRSKIIVSEDVDTDLVLNVGTSHFHKGNENDDVIITNDFAGFFSESSNGIDPNLTEEELYILFVAATRAKNHLYIPKRMYENYLQLRFYFNNDHENEIDDIDLSNHEYHQKTDNAESSDDEEDKQNIVTQTQSQILIAMDTYETPKKKKSPKSTNKNKRQKKK